ncbi:ATP-binding protein [Curvibacter sp. HBC61]|uniref:endopeptidase La n=1 Tax=Curvibacter cyanobacteriorum TaxID=3026422 RepID=A0ABT5MTJ5_9BURK|nr:ATP-binding protein [Curvibacter sp. HBC61]MDD0837148.1 ATP-binding protein [Curvibacter sp. HBC61]
MPVQPSLPLTPPPAATELTPDQLRRQIPAAELGFASTAELRHLSPGWIGQQRAREATDFGLHLDAPDYHLFVLGEPGSGRSSLLRQALQEAALQRPVPPDLAFLHHFEQPLRPLALRLPPGQGRVLRQALQQLSRQLPQEIPAQLESAELMLAAELIETAFEREEKHALAALEDLATRHGFKLGRAGEGDSERLQLLVRDDRKNGPDSGPSEAEVQVRREMAHTLARLREREQARDQALSALQAQTLKPWLHSVFERALASVSGLAQPEQAWLQSWSQAAQQEVLEEIELFLPRAGDDDEADRKADLAHWQACLKLNLVVDHAEQRGAPVVIEDNPQMRSLFGCIEHPGGDDAGPPDHTALHAGALLRAHGGYLMLHLADLADDEDLWDRLRRFLRSRQLQIEDGGGSAGPAGASLQPDPLPLNLRLVLIGSPDAYYKLQDSEPDMARRFRVKVDFADRFADHPEHRRAMAIWVAQRCEALGLPHADASGVAALLGQSHRLAEDQHYLSAQLGWVERDLIESAAACRRRGGEHIQAADVAQALQARARRHNLPEQELMERIRDGEHLLSTEGWALGQVNAMSQIDTGDHRFGVPMRITARTLAGHGGVLNIEREVKLSGPIHDKGVLILQGYLQQLLAEQAPLALSASLVFEQEYDGVEGDSASCAELFALLSALSGLPLRQGIAVTGALNQHGEVLPVGGLNEKIEGWFQVCRDRGLTGEQGVLLPARNQRQLMLSEEVVAAVAAGQFKVYTMSHVAQGVALLCERPLQGPAAGEATQASVQALALQTLAAYRRACQRAQGLRRGRGRA